MKSALMMILALGLLAPAPARGDIYINGQKVRGVTGLTLKDCTVTFNLTGDVHISAPGYTVAAAAAMGEQAKTVTQPTGPVAAVQNRYFLVTRTETPGAVPLDFEVRIGGETIKTISSAENGLVVELTLHLKPGKNTIEFRGLAKSTMAGAPGDKFGMIIGKGSPNAGSLEIDDVLLNYEVKANDPAPRTDSFEITVK